MISDEVFQGPEPPLQSPFKPLPRAASGQILPVSNVRYSVPRATQSAKDFAINLPLVKAQNPPLIRHRKFRVFHGPSAIYSAFASRFRHSFVNIPLPGNRS
jgi:hypothetical protein